nr:hypothetical protein BaRGS_020151 [Batillaria attramentaria]
MDEIESLCSWDATKPESLLCLIKELLEYYNQYNVQQASNFRRLQQDLTSLYQQPFSHADDLEFYITGSEVK